MTGMTQSLLKFTALLLPRSVCAIVPVPQELLIELILHLEYICPTKCHIEHH